jgi:HK97 family phage major capsid protein
MSYENPHVRRARDRYQAARDRHIDLIAQNAKDTSRTASAQRAIDKQIDAAKEEEERLEAALEDELNRQTALADARAAAPPATESTANYASARGSLSFEGAYRRDDRTVSFFADIVTSSNNPGAIERLQRNQAEMLDRLTPEQRAVTSSGGGVGFIPPVYLGDLWAELPRATRPFAAAIGSRPLTETGMTLSVPRITTGSLVASQTTQNTAIGNQDIVSTSLSVPVVTVARYCDLSLQAIERSMPGLDMVVFSDLRAAYDGELDRQMISGAGTTEHVGIRAVASINTVAYTASTPTGAGLLPKIYDGIQQIGSNRFRNRICSFFTRDVRHGWGKNSRPLFRCFNRGSSCKPQVHRTAALSRALPVLRP